MGILDLLMGTDPGILGQLLGAGAQTGIQPQSGGMPGGVPTVPGSSIPYGQGQTGLLGNGLLGNAARGALYGLGAAGQPGSRGFGAGLGRGAAQSIGMSQMRGQYGLQQAQGQQQLQAGARQGQLGLMTLNYYRRMQGLPDLDISGQPVPSSATMNTPEGTPQQIAQMRGVMGSPFGQAATQATQTAQAGLSDSPSGGMAAPAPGVPAAASALSGVPQGSDQWWQQLYAMGQTMIGVPGLAQDGVTLMEKAKTHDPSVIQTEAYAKAVGTAAGTPVRVNQGGSVFIPGQGVVYQAPVLGETVDNNPGSPTFGQKFKAGIDPSTGRAYGQPPPPPRVVPPPAAGSGTPPPADDNGQVTAPVIAPPNYYPSPAGTPTEISPGQTAEIKAQGDRNAAAIDAAQAGATAAEKHIQLLDQMRATADEFRLGAGSHLVASAQGWGQYFGITSDEANRQLGAYQDMRKLGVTAGASAIKDVSSREALQGQKMIWEAQPNPGMSPDGFRRVTDSLQGADLAMIAKNKWAASQVTGTKIDATWQSGTRAQAANVFWMQRMLESDPKLAQTTVTNLSKTPGGKALLQKIFDAKQWMAAQGLL